MPTVYLRTSDEQKSKLRQLASQSGLSENGYMLTLLEQAAGERQAPPIVDADVAAAGIERVTVRMPAFLRRAVADRAATAGMSSSRWIASLVQSNLMRSPVLTDAEIAVVLATRRELAAIGRNINQIARKSNSTFQESGRAPLDRLAELNEVVDRAQQEIRELVRASRNVWAEENEWNCKIPIYAAANILNMRLPR